MLRDSLRAELASRAVTPRTLKCVAAAIEAAELAGVALGIEDMASEAAPKVETPPTARVTAICVEDL